MNETTKPAVAGPLQLLVRPHLAGAKGNGMAKCDLCGGDCAAHGLAQLLTQYQAAGVRDVCPTCRRWADKTKGALLDQIAPQMRAAVEARKGEPPTPWWRRGLSALTAT